MNTITLSPGQKAVLKAFHEYGKGLDDQGLAVYVHHVADLSMSSSGVRSRRAELVREGLVRVCGVKRTKSGRSAAIHTITPLGARTLTALARKASKASKAATA